jgi:hypothetical protein
VPVEFVTVPEASDMDDETFLKHLDARHSSEVKQEKALAKSPHIMEAWVKNYRAFHQRLHDIAAPGQHDHEHEEDW